MILIEWDIAIFIFLEIFFKKIPQKIKIIIVKKVAMKRQLLNLKTMLVALFSILCLTLSYSQAVEVDFDFTVTDANMTVQVGADVCP